MFVYGGLFLVAFATLTYEIALVRLLSVITWYHLSFFAISASMLGMTAGATNVYLRRDLLKEGDRDRAVCRACLQFWISIPLVLLLLCVLPIGLYRNVLSPLVLLLGTAACSTPFFFSGIVITTTLTWYDLPIGRLYASDLIGAALGCLFVLGGLQLLDAPSLILVCSAIGALAGLSFAKHAGIITGTRSIHKLAIPLFVLLAISNAQTPYGVRPIIIKKRIAPLREMLLEEWNSFSRIVVYRQTEESPQYWGPSPLAPTRQTSQYRMDIDGQAGTTMRRFGSLEEIDHLRYDVTNVGYHLGRQGPACVIGVGGGRDIQAAILFGHRPITGIDVNPIFVDLLQGPFKDFAGIAGRPDVKLVVDDARSYLARSTETFQSIQMSLIDTWAATGAGAFSLNENALYTVEGWNAILRRLAPDGVFMVSRWHSGSDLGETGRILSLAVTSLLELGAVEPEKHLALITADRISTLILSPSPLGEGDIDRLRTVCDELQFRVEHLPGSPPSHALLKNIIASRSLADLEKVVSSAPLDYSPPTDDNPYFFNMLKLGQIGVAFEGGPGVVLGNLYATLTLVALVSALLLVALVTIVLPLLLKTRRLPGSAPSRLFWSGAAYFSLIGAAFMLAEIAMIQRLTIFLGHPMYGLGVLLFTIIAATEIGSFFSDKLPLDRRPWAQLFPLLAAAGLVCMPWLLSALMEAYVAERTLTRVLMAIVLLSPMGILMGFFFPAGMRMVKGFGTGDTPWYWALNGIFGVLCSAVAVLVSILLGDFDEFLPGRPALRRDAHLHERHSQLIKTKRAMKMRASKSISGCTSLPRPLRRLMIG